MKKIKNKIVEITETEIYHTYLESEMYIFMTFPEYKEKVKAQGIKVIDEQ